MNNPSRRELMQYAALFAAAGTPAPGAETNEQWVRHTRILLAEAYNYPFFPVYRYQPERALEIAQALNADSIRFPAASFYAYYPTRSRYPIHPELGSQDPFRRTVELFHNAGLKVVAYLPLNHPFMYPADRNPNYDDWVKRDRAGRPMSCGHLGYPQVYEGCLNSPLRAEYLTMVEEVITGYPVDVMYFDGPYQGMTAISNGGRFCHCRYCREAYRQARGKEIPVDETNMSSPEYRDYYLWLRDDRAAGLLRDAYRLIGNVRKVPVLYNNTAMLSRDVRGHIFPDVDGFMFEGSMTPEEKLFNLQLGRSTGKVIWTYIGHHTQHNREHLSDRTVRGWMGYPVESEDLLMDGAVAQASGVGMIYWSLNRFYGMKGGPREYESGRHAGEVYDFARRHQTLLTSLEARPQAGILVSTQTIEWFRGSKFQPANYGNYYHGAFQLLRDNGYDGEPFLDHRMTAESLRRYRLLYLPNAACLSREQCAMITAYVEAGGTLLATHMTSVADETGRVLPDFQLAELFGAHLNSADPVEAPDVCLRDPSGAEILPQDPQFIDFTRTGGATLLAENFDRGWQKRLGPAVVTRKHGKGSVIYVGSGMEAVYDETRIADFRRYIGSLIDPYLDAARTYRVQYRPGVMPHLAASDRTLLLHLLANVGNKWKKTNGREAYSPIFDVQVWIRIPRGRSVKSVSLLRAAQPCAWKPKDSGVEIVVPRILVHEAVRVDLV